MNYNACISGGLPISWPFSPVFHSGHFNCYSFYSSSDSGLEPLAIRAVCRFQPLDQSQKEHPFRPVTEDVISFY